MPFIALLVIFLIALSIVRVGAKAFMMTGLPRDIAEFQALSCFFGVGYTTNEAEMIVNHPRRRRIAGHLIIWGNIGITSALSTVILTFIEQEPDWLGHIIPTDSSYSFYVKIGYIVVGLLLIWGVFRLLARLHPIERLMERALKRMKVFQTISYETVLHSSDGYSVMQVLIEPDNELIGATLAGATLAQRGVLVLSIQRDAGEMIATPLPTTEFRAGDLLTVYGREYTVPQVLGVREGSAAQP